MTSNKNPRLPGEVTVWMMTEEQRLAYIEKHPIVPSDEHLKYWDWDGGKRGERHVHS
ncbi:hypothetical protein ABE353_14940 [Bacillus licheniformis]